MVTISPNLIIQEIGLSAESTVSSLKFARLIQDAILSNREGIKELFGEFSILYQPKNIIGGDFYFHYKKGDMKYLAVCDCTGHGISGALLTILGHNMLERAFKKFSDLGDILTFLNKYIIDSFSSSSGLQGLGMDIIIVGVNTKENELEYCGARRPLWLLSNDHLTKHKTKKASIGTSSNNVWISEKIEVNQGDKVFMFSDGITDQFCDQSKTKMGSRKLTTFINNNKKTSLDIMSTLLEDFFLAFKGNEPYTDDALFLGIEV